MATMSQHLSKLRLAGLISARQEGRHHIYTVEDPHILTLVQQIFAQYRPRRQPRTRPTTQTVSG